MHTEENEQRRSTRYETKGVGVSVGWYGPGGFQSVPGELLNLSLGGAAVSVAGLPRETGVAWLGLAGRDSSEWVGGRIVDLEDEKGGDQRIRMRFPENCPYELFKFVALSQGKLAKGGLPEGHRAEPAFEGHSPSRLEPELELARWDPEPARSAVPANHLQAAFAGRHRGMASRFSR